MQRIYIYAGILLILFLFFVIMYYYSDGCETCCKPKCCGEKCQISACGNSFLPCKPKCWPDAPEEKGCYGSVGERYTIMCAEHIFGKEFKKCRPVWLRNPCTNRCLELDGYNEEMGLAFEYNGAQHYNWPNFTNCSYEDFVAQVERDKIKREICKDNCVCLITIPYTIKKQDIGEYMYNQLVISLES